MITIENFFEATVGTWHQIAEIPASFTFFFKSGNSEYYTNKDRTVVCRVSDHWGSGIRECNWYLKGHPRNNSFLFSKRNGGHNFIGIITLAKLVDISNI